MKSQEQMDLSLPPTLAKAKEERDEAMARVEENAGLDWNAYADLLIRQVAQAKNFLTSDDIMLAMEFRPHDCRALGPAMKRAAKAGIIRAVGYKPSVRRHATPVRLWESLRRAA